MTIAMHKEFNSFSLPRFSSYVYSGNIVLMQAETTESLFNAKHITWNLL